MIALDFDARAAITELRLLSMRFPRETMRGLARYGGLVRRRMAKAMKAGGGEPTSAIRDTLHPGKPGGALAAARAIRLEKNPARFRVRVDWVPALRGYASKWQDGGDVGFGRTEVRRAIHIQLGLAGMRGIPVDPSATQPARPVSQLVRDECRKDAPRVIRGMVMSILEKRK